MSREAIRALLWKEWRETRWKWLAFFAAFHIPLIIGTLVLVFNERVRFDVAVATNQMVVTFMNIALIVQSGFVVSAGLFLLAFFAAGAVAPELASRQMFFLFERPLYRRQVLLLKFLVGLAQAILCVSFSILTTLTLAYFGVLLVAGGVTLDGSGSEYLRILGNALRGTLWTGLLGAMVFAGTFLFSVLFEKWWVGVIAGTFSLIGMFYFLGEKIFDWVLTNVIRSSRGPESANLELYAQLDPAPLVTMLVVTVVLYFTAQYMFDRKELKA
jgi:ABC-type transport system involved in multi-copper enzyme maturation permease subunit